jgi:hypothetical protein
MVRGSRKYSAYPGKVGPAAAGVAADLIIPQMFAEAASGQATPKMPSLVRSSVHDGTTKRRVGI